MKDLRCPCVHTWKWKYISVHFVLWEIPVNQPSAHNLESFSFISVKMSRCNAHLPMTPVGLKHSSDSQMSAKQSPSRWAWLGTPLRIGTYPPSQACFSSVLTSHSGFVADTTCLVFQILLRLWIFVWSTNFSMKCFLGGSVGKESAFDVGDLCLILGLGRPPGVGNGYPLQYPCLENSMDRGAWWATVLGVAKSWTRLSNLAQHTSHPLRVQACFPQNTFPWPFFSCSGLSRIHTSFFSYYVQIIYPHTGISLKYINTLIPTKL